MIEALVHIDREILLFINGMHFPLLDQFMILVSKKLAWIPAYAWVAYLLYLKLGWKKAVVAALLMVPLILIADQGSSALFKPWVQRFRPCHNGELMQYLFLPSGKCSPQLYGFFSSHAANIFAGATFLGLVFRTVRKRWIWIFLFCAALVGFSRVYLAQHYPSDVMAGAIWGIVFGILVFQAFSLISRKLIESRTQ